MKNPVITCFSTVTMLVAAALLSPVQAEQAQLGELMFFGGDYCPEGYHGVSPNMSSLAPGELSRGPYFSAATDGSNSGRYIVTRPAYESGGLTSTQLVRGAVKNENGNEWETELFELPLGALTSSGMVSACVSGREAHAISNTALVGQIIFTAGRSCPTGFMNVGGQLASGANHPMLAIVVGNRFGGEYSRGTFGLPDIGGVPVAAGETPLLACIAHSGEYPQPQN